LSRNLDQSLCNSIPSQACRSIVATILLLLVIGVSFLTAACSGNGSSPANTMRAFIQAAEKQDFDRAYASFVIDEVSADEVRKLAGDPVLFQGFQELKVDRWVVFAPPQSDRGRLTGTISYSSGHTGKFDAEMLQTPNGWRLTNVNIVVSSERIVNFGLQATTATPGR
jgi:hypothetical protein